MKRKISLNEQEFRNLIGDIVLEVLNEDHLPVVDNIDAIVGMIGEQWTSPDDFWYVYISQRYKDNLNTFKKNHQGDGSTNFRVNFIAYGIVSGNTKEEAIENLKHIQMNVNPSFQRMVSTKGNVVKTINSTRDISAVILLCNKFNARCYMTINKRSMQQTNAYAASLKKRGMEKDREFQFAAGRQMTKDDANVKWTQVRPWGLIDCDIDNKQAQQELENYLTKNGITPEMKYESHDGMHYLFSTRDAERLKFDYFDKKYRPSNAPRRQSDPMVLFKGDACMLLYSACGY
jgi:hypothetical protein